MAPLPCSVIMHATALIALLAALSTLCAAKDECNALPVPSKGMVIAYFSFTYDDGREQQVETLPTWDAAIQAFVLPVSTLAVLSCPLGTHLLVGNRTQPTGTLNQTCRYVTDEMTAFLPLLPDGVAISCKSPAHALPAHTGCGMGQGMCGAATCCSVNDTCAPAGMEGKGLCCPKGTSPCGDSLCCNQGESCVHNNRTTHCCSEGSAPCGTDQCCNAGEQCFPTLAEGRGVCCPGGKGYTPCVGLESFALSSGKPWHCCEAGEMCTLSLKEQEAWRPSEFAASGRCMPKGTTRCGTGWCFPPERCANASINWCRLRNATTSCSTPCAPGHCLEGGMCCPASMKACGTGACCPLSDSCWPHANGGQGLCCWPGWEAVPPGDPPEHDRAARRLFLDGPGAPAQQQVWWGECRPLGETLCAGFHCQAGQVCNPKGAAAANAGAGGMPCCPAGSVPCGATCCDEGAVCAPGAQGGRGLCCPLGKRPCGSTCCGAGDRCLLSAKTPAGVCCGGASGGETCGSACCSTPLWTCLNGECVRPCFPGEARCGKACCRPSSKCCGKRCCGPGEGCWAGRCVKAPKCAQGQQACGGACCRLCSWNRDRCCQPGNLTCFVAGTDVDGGAIPCGANGFATCGLWNRTCFGPTAASRNFWPVDDRHYCCADGTLPCPNVPKLCCPAGSACAVWPSGLPGANGCCARSELPCGDACCTTGQWCAQAWYDVDGRAKPPRCFDRASHHPCGSLVCPFTHTCYSGARFGKGLCCAPGQKPCRGTGRSGQADWTYCCPDA